MGIYRRKVINSDGKTIEYWIIRFQHDGHIYRKMVGKVGEISKSEVWRMYDEMVERAKMGRPDAVIDTKKTSLLWNPFQRNIWYMEEMS